MNDSEKEELAPTPKRMKRCRVCGDRAKGKLKLKSFKIFLLKNYFLFVPIISGFVYGGLACAGCRSFFRRSSNARRDRDGVTDLNRCRKNGNCVIDIYSRKCCVSCRYRKCLAIGMRRELISTNNNSNSHSYQVFLKSNNNNTNKPLNEKLGEWIKRELEASDGCDEDRYKTSSNTIALCQTLSAYERARIDEIQQAVASSFCNEENSLPPIPMTSEVEYCQQDLVHILNLAEYYIRRTVTLCKAFPAFRRLTPNAQLQRVKCYFTDLLIIRLCFSYVVERQGFYAIADETQKCAIFIRTTILLRDKPHLIERAHLLAVTLNSEMECDPTLRDLLLIVQLFTPPAALQQRSDNLDLDSDNFECFYYQSCIARRLLQRYLTHKHGGDERRTHAKLQRLQRFMATSSTTKNSDNGQMDELRRIVESLFIETDARRLASVLAEVFHY